MFASLKKEAKFQQPFFGMAFFGRFSFTVEACLWSSHEATVHETDVSETAHSVSETTQEAGWAQGCSKNSRKKSNQVGLECEFNHSITNS